MIGSAYAMSSLAAILHFYAAVTTGTAPSQLALRGVTVGFGALLAALLVVTRGQQGRGRVLWVVAMSVFAVSALHLSNHEGGEDPWWLQLTGHHASLPLALLILYQDFRFALADIFLKRALSFILLAGLTFGIFVFGVTPLLANGPATMRSSALLLSMWVLTALVYPFLRKSAGWFVDKIVLKRVDYADLAARLSQAIDRSESPGAILEDVSRTLAPALSAESIEWSESGQNGPYVWVQQDRRSAVVTVPTTDKPQYILSIRDLAGGRRLLSDDIAMLERGALLVARRIGVHQGSLGEADERARSRGEDDERRQQHPAGHLRQLPFHDGPSLSRFALDLLPFS